MEAVRYQLAGTTTLKFCTFFGNLIILYSSVFCFSIVVCICLHLSLRQGIIYDFTLLEDVTSFFLPLRLLKFFFDLPTPFQVNFSCLLTGDQSVFIQLYTKWNLLCVSLLGLSHPLNFCSVEK